MTQDEILGMFRGQSKDIPSDVSGLNAAIFELAQLLAVSRGKLPKKNFEALAVSVPRFTRMAMTNFMPKTMWTPYHETVACEPGQRRSIRLNLRPTATLTLQKAQFLKLASKRQ